MATAATAPSLYPLHHCKTIHLVRHAQGVHNVAGEKNHDAYLSDDLFDANLTPLGWKQVENLQKHIKASGLSRSIELVVVSPLLRTMQTAVGVFGGEAYTDGVKEAPLMIENVGHSDHPAVSSLNCPPFLAVELCREQTGLHPCDKRRTISEYREMFPAIDFSLIESDEDLWYTPARETKEAVVDRGLKFLEWLWTRKEKEIAVVTHSSFLFNTLGTFGDDCHPDIKSEIRTHVKQGKNIHSRTKTDPKLFAGQISFQVQQLSGTSINYLTDLRSELAFGVNMKVVDLFVIFPTHICTPESDICSSSYDPNTRERKSQTSQFRWTKPIMVQRKYKAGTTKSELWLDDDLCRPTNAEKKDFVGRRPVSSSEISPESLKAGFRPTSCCVVQRAEDLKQK